MSESRPTSELPALAKDFSRIFRAMRADRNYSILGLAKDAGVSNRMVTRMENPQLLMTALNDARMGEEIGQPRQKSAFSRVIIQIALTLGTDPWEWLRQLGLEWNKGDYERLQRIAEARLAKKRVVSQADLAGNEGASRIVRVSYVPLGPFADDKTPQVLQERSFFKEFADRVVGSVRYELVSEFKSVPENVRQLLLQEGKLKDGPTIIIGILNVVARELGIWTFCNIPLFRIRISFLVLQSALGTGAKKLSWRHLVGVASLPMGVEPKLIVVKESGAELLLRGVCRQSAWNWERLDYNTKDLADGFLRLIKQNDPSRPVVLAVDEVTAYEVARKIEVQGHNIVDLADEDSTSVPSYELAIAVHKDDPEFAQQLERIVKKEMFDSHASITANLYARFIAHTIWSDVRVTKRYNDCCQSHSTRSLRRRKDSLHAPIHCEMPSFARLTDSVLNSAIPVLFRREVIGALREAIHVHPTSALRAEEIEPKHLYPLVPDAWHGDVEFVFEVETARKR